MANHSNTKKAIRKTARKTLQNKMRKSRVRTFLKKFETAVTPGDAYQSLIKAQSEIMRAVSRGVFKMNTASRKISRLTSRYKKMLLENA